MKFEHTIDVPMDIEHGTVYIIGETDHKWLALLKCPCNCNATIHLNLLPETRPRWTFAVEGEAISLSPSIHRAEGCKAHFFIRKGEVQWA